MSKELLKEIERLELRANKLEAEAEKLSKTNDRLWKERERYQVPMFERNMNIISTFKKFLDGGRASA